jgi:hypothetical protein
LPKLDATHQKSYDLSQESKSSFLSKKLNLFGGTTVERLGIRYTSLAVFAAILTSCSAGFQGGVIPEKFKGAKLAEPISPESIQISWDGYPGATQYRLYSSENNNAIAQPQFTSIVFKPNLATAASTKYSVTAIDPSNGSELGSRATFIGPIPLLERFNFKATGHVIPVEAAGTNGTRLKVSWNGHPKVTYRIYLGERSADGLVNYNSFVTSAATVIGDSTTTLTGLSPGHEYCAVAVAAYLDNTNDGPDGTPFTTEISSTLNNWAVGTSGTFGDSKVAASQICARTSSSLAVDRVKIFSQKAFLSTRPIFYVYDSDHPLENDPASGFEAAIYQVSNATGLASYVGKTSGTGQVISLTDLLPGRYKFYAIVTGKTGDSAGSMAKKELIVGTATGEPAEADRAWIYIRGMPDLEVPANPSTMGYYPEKQQDGFGAQRLGSSVAVGDFDCDGKYDVAIGIPNATETSPRDMRSAQMGKVVVYYDIDDATSPSASPAPRSQLITFDITPYDPSGRDLQLGTQLYVGNFNKDNQRTNQNNPSGEANFQCHDLVIGSGYGPMFVLYGKRNVTGLDGGLNYSGTTGYAANPSSSCDTSTNVCSPALYTYNINNMSTKIGVSISSGNFNGSGYEDLVATTASANTPLGTLVFRGSENGLIPPTKMTGMRTFAQGCLDDITYPFPDGPKKGYPYIPATPNCFYAASTPDALENGWGKQGFGASVGVFPNAYYDLNGNATGTHRIRDVLLIGNPSYSTTSTFNASVNQTGRVFVCRPTTLTSAPAGMDFLTSAAGSTYDMNEYFAWSCGYNISNGSVIDPPLNGASVTTGSSALGVNFGASIRAVRNALLYDKGQLSSDGNSSDAADPMSYPNKPENIGFPGAVAIGASGSSNVFMYYGVHFPEGSNAASDGSASRDDLGNARNNHFSTLIAGSRAGGVSGSLSVVSEHPCRIVNSSGTVQTVLSANTPYREKCDVQQLTPPQGADWSSYDFAKTLYSIMGSNASTGAVDKQSILAVPAPTRTIASSGSVTFSRLGSIQLYYQSVVSESNGFPIRTKTTDSSCDFCRFSDGFANAGSSSIDFDGTKRDNIQFGAGGIAAGPLKAGSGSSYNSNADLVIGVPGFLLTHNTTEIVDSGAAQISFSHGGQFRPYQVTGTVGVASPWHFVNNSYGQEADIRYYQTIAMGDVDQDGFDDIAVRVKLGSQNSIRIIKGKSSNTGAVAFNNVAGQYTDFKVQGDSTAGMRVVPVGHLSTSQFPVYFVTGKGSSYLYFGGVGGLIPGQPSAFASGGAPRKLNAPSYNYLNFADAAFYNDTDNNTIADFGSSFAHGDFNGDGYEDLAIGYNSSMSSLKDSVAGTPLTYTGMTQDNWGRVLIFYGGKDNGFQVQADAQGGFPLNNAYFAPYSSANGVTNAACDNAGVCNKIQILYEGSNVQSATLNTRDFGKSVVAVPAGACNGVPVHALLVQANTTANKSKIYIYKPQCVVGANPALLSGLIQDGANTTFSGLTTFKSVIDPFLFSTPITTNTFGNSMVSVPGIMGSTAIANIDAKTHLVLTDSNKKLMMVFPLTSNSTNPADNCSYDANNNPVGSCKINITDDATQGYQKVNYANSNIFTGSIGFGASLASIGDVNGDGFNDVAMSITTITKPGTPNTSTGQQGAVMVVFGGDKARNGLQTVNGSTTIEPAVNSACYLSSNGATTTSVCNPTLLFAPQPSALRDGAGERTYLSRDSKVNFGVQNENLSSFLFGVPLRDSRETNSADRILRGGAFYVLP